LKRLSATLREILSVAVERDVDRRDIADLLGIPSSPVVDNQGVDRPNLTSD
jgi:hypothetical protein